MSLGQTLRVAGYACVMAMALPVAPVRAAVDCPPLSPAPALQARSAEAEIREFAAHDFKISGSATGTTSMAGRRCVQHYALPDGVGPGAGDIQRGYRDQLAKLGATVTFADDTDTFAKLGSDGQETWFHVATRDRRAEVVVLVPHVHRQLWRAASSGDYGLLGHMPNYIAATPQKGPVVGYRIKFMDGDQERHVVVDGTKYALSYNLKDGVVPNSDLDIQTSYRNAFRTLSAEILSGDENNTYARFENIEKSPGAPNGAIERPVWVRVHSRETSIEVDVLEEKNAELHEPAPAASALKAALDKDGRAILHLDFDFNRDGLKPVADPALDQIAKLLKDNPALKLSVEIHTDDIGSHSYNVDLSKDRALQLIAALVRRDIAEDRLTPAGYGPDRPAADNATAEGRALNRRVELVRM